MTEIATATDNPARQQLKDFLIPAKVTVMFYMFLGILTLALLKMSVIIELLLDSSQVSRRDVVVSDATTRTLTQVDSAFGSLSSFLIWMLIGTVFYSGLWVFRNTYHSVTTDITDSHAPTVLHKNHPYWKSNASKYLAVPAATIGVLIYIYFMLRTIRIMVLGSTTGIFDLVNGNVILWTIMSATLIAILLYVLRLLLRIVTYVYRSLNVGD